MKKIMTRLLSLMLLGAFIPSFVLADDWDLDKGSITVSATVESHTVSQAGGSPTVDHNPVITSSSGKTNNTVTITAERNATANVTLENVNIDTSATGTAAITTSGQGNVNIELDGTNKVVSGDNHAGLEKNNNGNLTITDSNKDPGSLDATGGDYGAGIGGGYGGAGSKITIENGKVTANGGSCGAGIGGGFQGEGTDIKVSGGEVKATGSIGGAGIGGGSYGFGSRITVEKGEVTAKGGDNDRDDGAGIGGGYMGYGSTINIENGTVTAKGGKSGGAGIGGGYMHDGTGITISGGDVNAQGGDSGAGIGGSGYRGAGTTIKVTGGNVEATGGNGCAGIGGGNYGTGSDIIIEKGKVTAQGGESGAGIGGGMGGAGTDIKVSGGEVIAKGGKSGAGIGGGLEGAGTVITVSNDAQVKVQGGEKYGQDYGTGAGIGNGGKYGQGGAELDQYPNKLNEGTIQYYAPGADMKTAAPTKILYNPNGNHNWNSGTVTTPATCTTPGVKTYTCQTDSAHTKTEEIPVLGHLFETYVYNNDATQDADGTETAKCERCDATDTRTAKGSKLTGNTAETAAEARQDAYWVCGADGQALPFQSQVKDGILTVTVQADTASLRGTTESLRQLEAQGITGIRFVTNKAQSDFTLSDLLTSGTGSFTLTHDGETVTFTLTEKDISGILK